MGLGNWGGPNYANPLNPNSGAPVNSGWGGNARPSIFTAAGRRERARERQERDAERLAEEMVRNHTPDRHGSRELEAHILRARMLERELRRRDRGNGSGNDGHSRWTSSSTDNYDAMVNDWGGRDRSMRGPRSANTGIFGGASGSAANALNRRYSNYGRPMAPHRESDGAGTRDRSTSPPDRPMPGAFSPTPPRRDSARSSSGSGSGTGGSSNGGGMLSWVRDRLPGNGSRRGDST